MCVRIQYRYIYIYKRSSWQQLYHPERERELLSQKRGRNGEEEEEERHKLFVNFFLPRTSETKKEEGGEEEDEKKKCLKRD